MAYRASGFRLLLVLASPFDPALKEVFHVVKDADDIGVLD